MDYDLAYFRGRLKIDRSRLDDELEIHADHSDRIGRMVAKMTRAEAFAKRDLERTEAEEISRIIAGQVKTNATAAASEARLTRSYQKAWEDHQNALETLRLWESLGKAWYQRGFDLKALGDLYGHQYFRVDTLTGPSDLARARQQQRDSVSEYVDRLSRKAERHAHVDAAAEPPRRTVLRDV